jgi:AraC family transcriptional regulator
MTTVAAASMSQGAPPAPSILGFTSEPRSFAPALDTMDAATSLLGRLLTDAFAAFDEDRDTARSSLSRAVALLQAEHHAPAPIHAQPTQGVLAPWQAKKAAAHIEENLEFTIRIGDLAALTRLSTSYFSRAFKSTFGHTPRQFILDRRVARAQQTMLTTEDPLCGIALACGFSDQAHLSRAFRRSVGASPAQWRRTRRASQTRSARAFAA